MTKPLGFPQFNSLVNKIGAINIYAPSWGGVLILVDEENKYWNEDATATMKIDIEYQYDLQLNAVLY